MNTAAANARENARHSDGKFGSYQLVDAGVDDDLNMSFLDEEPGASDFGAETTPEPVAPKHVETPYGAAMEMSLDDVGVGDRVVMSEGGQDSLFEVIGRGSGANTFGQPCQVLRLKCLRTPGVTRLQRAFRNKNGGVVVHDYLPDQGSTVRRLLPKTTPSLAAPALPPEVDPEQARIERLAATVGDLPRAVKSVRTTAERLGRASGPRIEVTEDEIMLYGTTCRCGEPAVKHGGCAKLLHQSTGRPLATAYLLSSRDGRELAGDVARHATKMAVDAPDDEAHQALEDLAFVAQHAGNPKALQAKLDVVRQDTAKAEKAAAKAAAPSAPRKMRGWREHIAASAEQLNASARAHGIQIANHPDIPEEVYVSVPVQATFRGQPQFERDGVTPRNRSTGAITVRIDPTDRGAMNDVESVIRAQVAANIERLRQGDPRFTPEANAGNAKAADIYAAWLKG